MSKWIGLAIALQVSMLAGVAQAAPFTPGNLVVLRAPRLANVTFGIVELTRTGVDQTPPDGVQNIQIDSGFRISGSATSTGYLSHTDDRSLLTFTGAVSTDTTSNANTLNPRNVGTLDANGIFTVQTSYTGTSGNQTRSATSLDNINWFIADQGGIYTNGAIAASPAGNQRGIKSFAGIVYVGSQSTTVPMVSTLGVPSGGTLTGLPGIPASNAFQDFYLIQSGASASSYDVLYVLSATSNTAGTIDKYSLLGSGSWSSNGSFVTTFGGFGLAAAPVVGGGATLFLTTGLGALMNNDVLRLSDSAGYNEPISIDGGATIRLFTAPFTTNMKGIDFVPVAAAAAPVPALGTLAMSLLGVALLGSGLLGLASSRRRAAPSPAAMS